MTDYEDSEVYQPLEPTIVKVTASASIQTASAACQTIVTGEDWVTKSSIAEDAEHIRKIQVVIDRELKKVDNFLATWFDAVQKSSEKLKEQTLQWQNDHTALSTNLAVLKGFRNILDQHKEDVQKTRQLTDRVSAKVKRLEQTIEQKEKAHQADLQSYEKKYQECRKEVDELIGKIGVLAKGNDGGIATLVNTDTKEASKVSSHLFGVASSSLEPSSWMQIWDLARRKVNPSLPILQSCRKPCRLRLP